MKIFNRKKKLKYEGSYSNNLVQTQKNGFFDPPRWILRFRPWYWRWKDFRWILVSPQNLFVHIINIWATGVDQSWQSCENVHFFSFGFSWKIHNFVLKWALCFEFFLHNKTSCEDMRHGIWKLIQWSFQWKKKIKNI